VTKVPRFNLDNYCHFVTVKTNQNRRIFSFDQAAELLILTIYEGRDKLNFKLIGFVVMPDHIHLMLVPNKRNTISDVMRHIKGRFSRRYNLLSRGMNSPGYGAVGGRSGNSSLPVPKIWQESFYDHVIRNENEFLQRLNYIHVNPVRAGLTDTPEKYRFSSAAGKFQVDLENYFR
jgi:putative transposase